MNTERPFAWGTLALVLSALFLSHAYFSTAYARSGGISGVSTTGCADGCHDDSTGAVSVSISGSDTVLPESTNIYTLTISGGPAVTGGLDVSAGAGILSVNTSETDWTRLLNSEITHETPKPFSDGTVSWLFDWQAPDVVGSVNLFAAGLSANDGMGNSGDDWGLTTFNIQVVPIPAAAILFGSALGLLGWVRRRRAA